MKLQTTLFALTMSLALTSSARSSIVISEVLIEPDGPRQFFELQGAPGASLAGLTLVIISGEGSGSIIGDSGTIDQFLDLSGFSLGSNGLLLWANSAAAFDPPADPATTVITANTAPFDPGFVPAFWPGVSQTFALVSGFTGDSGDDLDSDNDGALDVFPWSGVVDAIGIRGERQHAGERVRFRPAVGLLGLSCDRF